MASSNSATASEALIRSDKRDVDSMWRASPDDVDADGDFVYSVVLSSSADSYIASLRADVANVAVIMLYVQCRERPGRWSVATAPVCYIAICNTTTTTIISTTVGAIGVASYGVVWQLPPRLPTV